MFSVSPLSPGAASLPNHNKNTAVGAVTIKKDAIPFSAAALLPWS